MQKSTLLKISLIITLSGIFFLTLLTFILEPKLITINNITQNQLNQQIKIQGIITNINTYKDSNFQVLTIKDKNNSIQITINKITNLKHNQLITITGKVTEYKNTLQIQADKISLTVP